VSVATTSSTLLASDIDETQSRDATVSANHVAPGVDDVTTPRSVANSCRELPFVSRNDSGGGGGGDVVGPPWLPTTDSIPLHDGELHSLQFGASSLLAFVYDRQTDASASLTTVNHVDKHIAVKYSARAVPSSSNLTSSSAAPFSSSVETNSHSSGTVLANSHQTQLGGLSSDVLAQRHQVDSMTNDVCESAMPFEGSTFKPTSTTVDEDLSEDVDVLRDEQVQSLTGAGNNDTEPSVVTSPTAVLNIADYLLSDFDEAPGELVNGSDCVADNDVDVLRQNDVDVDVATNGVASRVIDARRMLSSDSGQLTELIVTRNNENEADETWRCADSEDVSCVEGHLQSTPSDARHLCTVCLEDDVTPPSCDVNSNVTSSTSAVTASGDRDGDSGAIESPDVDECRRIAEEMSAAWTSTERRTGKALGGYDFAGGDLVPLESHTSLTHVS